MTNLNVLMNHSVKKRNTLFSITQILCETNFEGSRSVKSAISTVNTFRGSELLFV